MVDEFAKITFCDVVLPAQITGGSQRTIDLRCVATPDEAQKVFLNRLGLGPSQRLRRIAEVERM